MISSTTLNTDALTTSLKENEPCDIFDNGTLIITVISKSNTLKRPVRGDLVTVDLMGKLVDGERVVENKMDFKFHVGDLEVCEGLEAAIQLINIGTKAEISVDPGLAYGTLGLENVDKPSMSIPPDAKIIYTVTLWDIKSEEETNSNFFELRKKFGAQKKERGIFWHNRHEYNKAIHLYRRALDFLEDCDGDEEGNVEFRDEEDLERSFSISQTLVNDRLEVYNCLALSQIHINALDEALKSVNLVLNCQPNNVKATYTKGRILERKGDIKGAISLLEKAAALDPALKEIVLQVRREEQNQMMAGQDEESQKKQVTQSSKLKLALYVIGTLLVVTAAIVWYWFTM